MSYPPNLTDLIEKILYIIGCPIFRRLLRKNTFGSYSDRIFIVEFKNDFIFWLWRHIYATPSGFLTVLAYLEL